MLTRLLLLLIVTWTVKAGASWYDWSLGDNNFTCLERCNCYRKSEWRAVVDCSARRLRTLGVERWLDHSRSNESAAAGESIGDDEGDEPRGEILSVAFDFQHNHLRRISDEFFEIARDFKKYRIRSKIEQLDLSFNRIQRIGQEPLSNSFEPLHSLKRLYLQYNQLSQVPDLSNLTRLEVLQLSYNRRLKWLPGNRLPKQLQQLFLAGVAIKRITSETLQSLSVLQLLDVSDALGTGVRTRTIERNAFGDLVNLTDIKLSHTRWGDTINEPDLWRPLIRLKSLEARRCYLREPLQLTEPSTGVPFSPGLVKLDYTGNKFSSENITLTNLPNLEILYLNLTRISSMPVNAFTSMPLLKELHMSAVGGEGQNLSTISNANCLSHLDISFNHLTSIPSIPSSVRSINLKGNHLDRVRRVEFSHLHFLERLDFTDQNISSIEANAFNDGEGANNLQVLILNKNKLRKVERESFYGLQDLRELQIRGNLLTVLNESLSLPALEIFSASGNKLTVVLGNVFMNMTHLRKLDLSHNQLYRLLFDSDLPSLAILQLNNNNFTTIPPLSALPQLESLDLSNNKIQEMTTQDFNQCCSSLHNMTLSHNQIVMPPLPVFRTLSRLESLDISHNNMSFSHEAFSDLRGLRQLIMENSNLTQFPNVTFPLLEHLSLKMNIMLSLGTAPIRELIPRVESLDLSLNTIEYVEPGILDGLDRLHTVNLKYNDLICPCNKSSTYFQSYLYIKEWLKKFRDDEVVTLSANDHATQLALSYYCLQGEAILSLFEPFTCKNKTTSAMSDMLEAMDSYSGSGTDYQYEESTYQDLSYEELKGLWNGY